MKNFRIEQARSKVKTERSYDGCSMIDLISMLSFERRVLLLAKFAKLRAKEIAEAVEEAGGDVVKVSRQKGMTVGAVRRFVRAAEKINVRD